MDINDISFLLIGLAVLCSAIGQIIGAGIIRKLTLKQKSLSENVAFLFKQDTKRFIKEFQNEMKKEELEKFIIKEAQEFESSIKEHLETQEKKNKKTKKTK